MSTAWKDDPTNDTPPTSARPPRRLEPLYFRSGDRDLFACYHAAQKTPTGLGMVLVNSFGHEYIQFHRVLRQLAYMLAEAGIAVLRFDLTGCGDSAGEDEDGNLPVWREDVHAAVADLRQRAGLQRVGVLGLRLGGTLAHQVAGEAALDRLVLWDPIVDGSAHLDELDRLHSEMTRYAHVQPDPRGPAGREVLGFPMPESRAREIAAVDLLADPCEPQPPTLLIETNPNHSQKAFATHLAELCVVLHQTFDNPHLWVWIEDFAKVHVPHPILQRIVAWCTESPS